MREDQRLCQLIILTCVESLRCVGQYEIDLTLFAENMYFGCKFSSFLTSDDAGTSQLTPVTKFYRKK